jgi:hypothetical protein
MSLEQQNTDTHGFASLTQDQLLALLARQNMPVPQAAVYGQQGYQAMHPLLPQTRHSGSPSPVYHRPDINTMHTLNQAPQQITHQFEGSGTSYASGTKRARVNSGSNEEGYQGAHLMSAETLLAIEAKIEELQEDIQFLRVEVQSQGEQIQELKTRDAEGVKSKAAKKTDPKLLVSRWIN